MIWEIDASSGKCFSVHKERQEKKKKKIDILMSAFSCMKIYPPVCYTLHFVSIVDRGLLVNLNLY